MPNLDAIHVIVSFMWSKSAIIALLLCVVVVGGVAALDPGELEALEAFRASWIGLGTPAIPHPWLNVSKACDTPPLYGLTCYGGHIVELYVTGTNFLSGPRKPPCFGLSRSTTNDY